MQQTSKRDIRTLLGIMATLRDPVRGCPWDREQDFGSIAPYTIEEAYEVADAIDRDDLPELRDELGDLLFQVVFHAQMASELRAFDFGDVVEAISEKMIRRHPHVFGAGIIESAGHQRDAWEQLKASERASAGRDSSAIGGVVQSLPALSRAEKLGKRAARVGLDWPDPRGVADKVREELDEVAAALSEGEPHRVQEEIGDLLLACASLARHCRVDPEEALRQACRKFEARFRRVEDAVQARGAEWRNLGADELDRMWEEAKTQE
ncbi:MAG: nucleoside triphosphate pyrophosphohydrolase [Chromatiales bacterium]|nr:nucleoside triphosphate pyrophosphohydrolase [Chromatiales bacterium]